MSGHSRACTMDEQATAFALYALEPEQELAVRAHLAGCGPCRAAVRDTEVVTRELARSVEQVDPPPSLRAGILAAARPRSDGRRPVPAPYRPAPDLPAPAEAPDRTRRPRRRRGVVALAAAAAIAVGALAGYSVHVQQERDAESARVAALTTLISRLDGPATVLRADRGEPVATVLSAAGEHTLVASGLRPNDPARSVYVVWGIGTAAPRAIGTLDVTGPDPAVLALGPGEQPFLGYAISLEPGRAAPDAPTTVVAS